MKFSKRLIVLLVLTALAEVGVLGAAAVALDRYLDPFDDLPFDQTAWAVVRSQNRGPMARDAMRYLPAGMSAGEVRELLGEPDPFPGPGGTEDGFGNPLRGHETWAYYLGCWSALDWYGLDSAFLYVYLDREGTVVSAEIAGG